MQAGNNIQFASKVRGAEPLPEDPTFHEFVSDCANTVADAVHRGVEDLTWLEKKVNILQSKLHQLCLKIRKQACEMFGPNGTICQHSCTPIINKCREVVREVREYLGCQKKPQEIYARWRKLQLPPEVIDVSPECVLALVRTGVAYAMAAVDGDLRGIRVASDAGSQHVEIFLKGTWVPWEQFCVDYQWDDERGHYISKTDPSIELTYVDPQLGGFIEAKGVFPIKQITPDVFLAVKAQAAKFRDGIDPKSVDSVLQIFTSPGDFQVPPVLRSALSFLGRGDAEEMPSHYGVRLIRDNKVYSIGPLSDVGAVELSRLGLGVTMNAKIRLPDADEYRPFRCGRPVTSLPLNPAQAQAVFSYFEDAQARDGLAFNIGSRNCSSWACDAIRLAGVEPPDLRESCGKVVSAVLKALWRSLTESIQHRIDQFYEKIVKKIDVWAEKSVVGRAVRCCLRCIGNFCCWVARGVKRMVFAVKTAVQVLFERIWAATPSCVKKLCQYIWKVISFPFDRLHAALKTLLVWSLGGTKMTQRAHEGAKARANEYRPFMQITSFADVFRHETTDVESSARLLAWQKEQKSTQNFEYHSRPELTLC